MYKCATATATAAGLEMPAKRRKASTRTKRPKLVEKLPTELWWTILKYIDNQDFMNLAVAFPDVAHIALCMRKCTTMRLTTQFIQMQNTLQTAKMKLPTFQYLHFEVFKLEIKNC